MHKIEEIGFFGCLAIIMPIVFTTSNNPKLSLLNMLVIRQRHTHSQRDVTMRNSRIFQIIPEC